MTHLSSYPTHKQGWGWRLYEFDRPVTPWRKTKAEADEDAIKTGRGDRSPWQTMVCLYVPARIVHCPKPKRKTRSDKGVKRGAKNGPTSTNTKSRKDVAVKQRKPRKLATN